MSENRGVEPVFRALDDNIYKTKEAQAMSENRGVEPVFRALDDNIYKTEEKARKASIARSVRNGMLSRLCVEGSSRSSSAFKSAKCEALEWFISDMDDILAAYYDSLKAAKELMYRKD